MVVQQAVVLDRAFHALADPTRRRLLETLAAGEKTVTQLAEPLPMSLPAVTKHLAVLEASGLVASRKHGRSRHVRLRAGTMKQAVNYMMQYRTFWEQRLDALAQALEEETQ